jgi:hypothetical protein
MTGSPSRYGGIAAVLVLGIGLLATGRTWGGIAVLAFGLLLLAFVLCPSASGRALLAAIGALLLSGLLAWQAAHNELTGTATYSRGRYHHEFVTREQAPAKFREATNFLWAGSIFAFLVAGMAFTFSRKLQDSATDF